MRDFHVYVYIEEIARQCRFAEFAYQRLRGQLDMALRADDASDRAFDQFEQGIGTLEDLTFKRDASRTAVEMVFFWVQSFLVHVGIIAKMLWISDKARKKSENAWWAARCDSLKRELGITNVFTIEDPNFRNVLIHIDGELDDWAKCDISYKMDFSVHDGREPAFRELMPLDRAHFRELHAETMEFSFGSLGKINLSDAATELRDILTRADAWVQQRSAFSSKD